MGSALLFGNAVDGAINELLMPTGAVAEDIFLDRWHKQEINGVQRILRLSNEIKYSKSDLDEDHFTEYDKKSVEAGMNPSWLSLQYKGLMIIDAYRKQILPRIKRVIAVQKHLSMTNAEGDTFIGYADLICEWEDGRILLCDNKTSSIKYDPASASNSKQLATYVEAIKDDIKVDGVAYIVIPKKFRKIKEPKVNIEVVFGTIQEALLQQTFEDYDKALNGIKMGEFPCSSPSCDTVFGECVYKKLCCQGSMEGLIELSKKSLDSK